MADVLRDWLIAKFPGEKSESPMEALLFAGWELMAPRRLFTDDAMLRVKQQAPVGKYRADFLFSIKAESGEVKRLVVEVDGHNYHERTKEQAAHDKARDRWMTGAGHDVIRFTGSEVWANPFKCADEIADRLHMLRFGVTRGEALARAGMAALRALLES